MTTLYHIFNVLWYSIVMTKDDILNEILTAKKGIITSQDAKTNNISPSTFIRFANKKKLIRTSNGTYVTNSYVFDELYELQKHYPKLVYSGHTALYLSNLTDSIPEYIEITIPRDYKIRKNVMSSVELRIHTESNKDYLEFGNKFKETIFGNKVRCFSDEKAIIELIKKRDKYDSETFLKALRRYWKNENKDISLLIECAKWQKIEKHVYQLVEVIANEDQ